MFSNPLFGEFAAKIRDADNALQVLRAWDVIGGLDGASSLRVVTVLRDYDRNVTLRGLNLRDLAGRKLCTPYFLSESLHFSSLAINDESLNNGQAQVAIDGSLMLDTNVASYLSTYINRESFGSMTSEAINLIDQLLFESPNYDYIPYLLENSKKFFHLSDSDHPLDEDQFWRNLDAGFKKNLVALKQFASIDEARYRKNGSSEPRLTEEMAIEDARRDSFDFYFGEFGKTQLADTRDRFKISLILMYKLLYIQLSSKAREKNKILSFMTFMLDRLGAFFERETFLALDYFRLGQTLPSFQKVHKGMPVSRPKAKSIVENMTWDLLIPRLIESLASELGEGDFFVPHVLTWDTALRRSLESFPAKACIYDDSSRRVVTIPAHSSEERLTGTLGADFTNEYFSLDARTKRLKRKKLSPGQLQTLLKEVEDDALSVICQRRS